MNALLAKVDEAVATANAVLEGKETFPVKEALERLGRLAINAVEALEDLRLEADCDEAAAHHVEGRISDLKLAVRRAKLFIAKRDELRVREDRESLLRGSTRDTRKLQTNEVAKLAGAELTESMRQAAQMMTAEVEKSVAAVEALQTSTKMLEKTRAQYSVYESVLTISSNLVHQIHRGSIMDKLVLFGGLGIFLLTVCYIMWKRTWIPGFSMLFSRKEASSLAEKTLETVLSSVTSTASTFVTAVTPIVTSARSHDEL
ncbi:Protein transport protein sec20 [Chytriomyces hyalinus]|nr:Protein transport protein sec20 [Chytriomyces hyalinus]